MQCDLSKLLAFFNFIFTIKNNLNFKLKNAFKSNKKIEIRRRIE